ncbi:MAG: imidazole glycerol phosphate synthase subunit HisH [Geminicoccaceae bacterium]|nr:imidazole glycerol phosphate synthase subunit HisH [Geminicoccaceae bacterium]MCB9945083.1 imidazole glycerol phosphate synthase subunit HisH [Geminicoccaceae bacterium]
MPDVVIVPTGTANIASVKAAFRRLGAEPRIAETGSDIEQASHVMLPGVGAFGASMRRLQERGMDRPLIERARANRPTIAICVGHQLLFESSDESPGVRGLGIAPGHITRFGEGVRVPQFGWNQVETGDDALLLEDGWAYFANSYRAGTASGWRVAHSDHGGRFVAAMQLGNIIGCQFHPELSGPYGEALLSRFLEQRA